KKDVAKVLAPAEKTKKEEKAEEKTKDKDKEAGKDKKDEKAADDKKLAEDKKKDTANKPEGVKEVEDPAKKDEKAGEQKAEKEEFKEVGPADKLVVDGAKAETQEKREMGDVFFVASLAALAHTDRNLLEKNCRENGDRSFTVTFYERDPQAESGYKEHEVVVESEALAPEADQAKGKSKDEGKTDRLTSIITQAYTQWKGGEDKIGEGKGGAAMEALTGAPSDQLHCEDADQEALWTSMVEACTWNRPILATTKGDDKKALFNESEVKPWHAYVVLKCKEVNGKRMVTLRNPFARSGSNEGNVLEFDMEKFAQLYRGVTVSQHLPQKEAKAKKSEDKKKADDKKKGADKTDKQKA
ncbi:MAG: C2 family cysteine protease, partial [Myxococcota bacterium]|nr:C2 family cysteine protease [Myxococcota bacterium]